MAREVKTKLIGDDTYTINQFPATKANKILFKLKRFLGASLMEIMSVDLSKKDDASQAQKLGSAIAALGEGMTEDEFTDFCKLLLSECFLGTTPVTNVMESHFMGKLEDMYVLMVEVVKVNYSGFLKSLAALKAQAPVKASGSTSLNT